MADPRGFLNERERALPARRPVPLRLMDYKEIYEKQDPKQLHAQASRCMDCGIPFCHQGCPLGNIIPEWNDLTYRGDMHTASERLHATNNFPEFTGRLCPAPCESACVLGISQPAVTIKRIEQSIADEAVDQGWIEPQPPQRLTGKTVAVVGSGPAGLAAAQQLTRAGHTVAVFERDDRIGGLLRYGIPDFKMERQVLDRRLEQMREEGTRFRPNIEIGRDISWSDLRRRYDAVIIATGAPVGRELNVPGRSLRGVHQAMEFLVQSNHAVAGDDVHDQITAEGKHVIVIGGGDTGSDCIGTAHRQGAASVTNIAIGKKPPEFRTPKEPWPMTPRVFEVQTSHEEGGERLFEASTVEFVSDADGHVVALQFADTDFLEDGRRVPKAGTERTIPADLVLLSMGFTGPEQDALASQLEVGFTSRGNIARDDDYATNVPGVFAVGDAGRGASLIVWAIAEGRAAAAAVEKHLLGASMLPSPVRASEMAISLRS
ncbi:glutamate synthase subunit beta [Gulosibacter molinativorax]|uniref:Glutamate synthase subunit beta n=1 Tax=Gulosibacter molinativorax TaxID=256821 RepID=A0ABT7C9H3_9MICO|nr:glutamate synthase subunit beta [Gulosibacter molinativorax]MDJ1371807.1 glutamate synthase subunit beta [Gulosibacter molinativorax]QUY60821.1 Glutamate synthase [Gulosibacter molinativorax]